MEKQLYAPGSLHHVKLLSGSLELFAILGYKSHRRGGGKKKHMSTKKMWTLPLFPKLSALTPLTTLTTPPLHNIIMDQLVHNLNCDNENCKVGSWSIIPPMNMYCDMLIFHIYFNDSGMFILEKTLAISVRTVLHQFNLCFQVRVWTNTYFWAFVTQFCPSPPQFLGDFKQFCPP